MKNSLMKNLFRFFFMLMLPFTLAIKQVGEGGTSGEPELLAKIQTMVGDQIGALETKFNTALETLNKNHEAGKKLVDELNTKIASLNLSDEQMKALKISFEEINKNFLEVKTSAVNLGAEITSIKQTKSNSTEKPKTFKDCVYEALKSKYIKTDKEGKEYIDADLLARRNYKSTIINGIPSFVADTENATLPGAELKVAVDMTNAAALSGINTGYLTQYEQEPVRLPLTQNIHLTQVFPVVPCNNKYFGIVVEYTETDGSGTKPEGTAPAKSSFLLKTEEYKTHTIATYFHVSKETLEDIPWLLSEISTIGPDRLLSQIDAKILGTNATPATDLQGMRAASYVTLFTPATYAATVQDANLIDLISKMKLTQRKNEYGSNVVFLSPTNVELITGYKDKENNSQLDRRVVYGRDGVATYVCGLRIIETSKIGDNYVIIGKGDEARIGERKMMGIELGYDGSDFTQGFITVMLTWRGAFGVRAKAGFTYCEDIATALSTIDNGS